MDFKFSTLEECINNFNTEDKCRLFLEECRWGGEPYCIFCGSINVTRMKDGKRFQCNEKACRKQFSVTVGTIYENTKIPLTKWFQAIYEIAVSDKRISTVELSKRIEVTQKTAFYLHDKIINNNDVYIKKRKKDNQIKVKVISIPPIKKIKVVEKVKWIKKIRVVTKVRVVKKIKPVEKIIWVKKIKYVERIKVVKKVKWVEKVRWVDKTNVINTNGIVVIKKGDTLILRNKEYVYFYSMNENLDLCKVYFTKEEITKIIQVDDIKYVVTPNGVAPIIRTKPISKTPPKEIYKSRTH